MAADHSQSNGLTESGFDSSFKSENTFGAAWLGDLLKKATAGPPEYFTRGSDVAIDWDGEAFADGLIETTTRLSDSAVKAVESGDAGDATADSAFPSEFAPATVALPPPSPDETTTAAEPYRPTYHYTPETNWMNDPNGLFYLDGVYHMFYQHNPNGSQFGDMSWGHATSTDLVN